jgi:protein-disulfide isomerase
MQAPRDVQTVSTVGAAAAPSSRAPVAPDPRSLGADTAPVAVVEYSDYQCPYCQRFHAAVLPRLKSEYIDTGKVKLFFRDLPLTMHPQAMPAAVAARCAAQQGKFWPMNEALFAQQSELGPALYTRLAGSLALNGERFKQCLDDPETQQRVRRDAREAAGYEVSATPSFLLGRYDGARIEIRSVAKGFADFDSFARAIDKLLADSPKAD